MKTVMVNNILSDYCNIFNKKIKRKSLVNLFQLNETLPDEKQKFK